MQALGEIDEGRVAVEVDLVGYGRPATSALARRLAAAKADGHPLDPITVVVPSNAAGLSARRLLTTGAAGLEPCNLANVSFVTPYRLSEVLGSAHVDGRVPLTTPVLAAAVRATLAADAGMFAPVAAHQATQVALIRLFGELSRVRPGTKARIAAASVRGAEVVRLVTEIEARLDGYFDEDDLADAATAVVVAGRSTIESSGALVWHLPQPLSPALSSLLAACLQRAPRASVVMALTGDPGADVAVVGAVRAAGVVVDDDVITAAAVAPPTADRLVSVSDADEEVRQVIREIVQLVEHGIRPDRIAIFRPSDGSYGRTLVNQLEGAGIDHHGPANRRLSDSVAGRTLVRALALEERQWGRAAVVELVADAPIRVDDGFVPARRWDEISRRAGVVGGLDDWRQKLLAFAEAPDPSRRDLEVASSLSGFLDSLAEGLATIREATTWSAKSDAARTLLAALLGAEHRRTGWPDGEVTAAQRVDEALARLSTLDALEPDPRHESFLTAVSTELSAPAGRIGRFGAGVLVAPLGAAVGLDLDAVFVLGMAEGSCPAIRRDDALLPETDRQRGEIGELLTSDERLHTQHRNYLAALAAGGVRRTLLFPRGDLRGRRDRLPSRWLLDSASAKCGSRVFSSDVSTLSSSVLTVVPSYAAGVRAAAVHGSLADRDVAALATVVQPSDHPMATGDLGRGFLAQRSRAGEAFTEWDGNLAGQTIESPATGRSLSPSRLQEWAKCPFSYFLGSVLRLRERDDPERITELSPSEKGTLIHRVLETFIGEVLERPEGAPHPNDAWTPHDRERVAELAEEAFADVERRGLTGRALTWRRTQLDVRNDLEVFLTMDDAHRREQQLRPMQVELPFGLHGEPPLTLTLDSGKVLSFRGKADRIDGADNGRIVVLDYKTGSGRGYDDLATDPVREGLTLQLGIYAEAAIERFGADPAQVEASYWIISRGGGYKRHGYAWTDENRRRFLDVTEAIVDGIEGGTFPARSGEYDTFWGRHANCSYCDFDRVCSRDREDQQRAMADAPELSILERLQMKAEEA